MKCELINDNFQNFKRYQIPKAQLVIADIPYNIGNNAYASNPSWYIDGDNKNGESEKAGKQTRFTAKQWQEVGRKTALPFSPEETVSLQSAWKKC